MKNITKEIMESISRLSELKGKPLGDSEMYIAQAAIEETILRLSKFDETISTFVDEYFDNDLLYRVEAENPENDKGIKEGLRNLIYASISEFRKYN